MNDLVLMIYSKVIVIVQVLESILLDSINVLFYRLDSKVSNEWFIEIIVVNRLILYFIQGIGQLS